MTILMASMLTTRVSFQLTSDRRKRGAAMCKWFLSGGKEDEWMNSYFTATPLHGTVCLFLESWYCGIGVIKFYVLCLHTWVLWQLSQVTLQHHSNLYQQNLRKTLWNLNVTSLIINQSERLKICFIFAFNVCYLQLQDVITWTSFLKKEKLSHFATLPGLKSSEWLKLISNDFLDMRKRNIK